MFTKRRVTILLIVLGAFIITHLAWSLFFPSSAFSFSSPNSSSSYTFPFSSYSSPFFSKSKSEDSSELHSDSKLGFDSYPTIAYPYPYTQSSSSPAESLSSDSSSSSESSSEASSESGSTSKWSDVRAKLRKMFGSWRSAEKDGDNDVWTGREWGMGGAWYPPVANERSFLDITSGRDTLVALGSRVATKSNPNARTSANDNGNAKTSDKLPRTSFSLPPRMRTPGFTMLDRVYVRGGTLFLVMENEDEKEEDVSTDKEARMSERDGEVDREQMRALIISNPQAVNGGVSVGASDEELRIITPQEAIEIFGFDDADADLEDDIKARVVPVRGMSVVFWDGNLFMRHYYHWWGELVLGAIRVYSSLSLLRHEKVPLDEVRRFILPNVPGNAWRDPAGLIAPLMRLAFPSAAIEGREVWDDMKNTNKTYVWERMMIVSRKAAHKSPYDRHFAKMLSGATLAPCALAFWNPIRERVVSNVMGYLPVLDWSGRMVGVPRRMWEVFEDERKRSGEGVWEGDGDRGTRANGLTLLPLVTYINRQATKRRLDNASHDSLVEEMRKLEWAGLIRFKEAKMEEMGGLEGQVGVVAESAIIVGVHGNGLTHQLWMPSTPRSSIIEIFYPGTYLHDYEMLARNVGHRHYAMWNTTYVTYPRGDEKWFEGTNRGQNGEIHGSHIPVSGIAVAQLVREILTRPLLD
ncbi:hypothetical protein CVT24_010257 [Panaeolus cyanescens]|uniref:Glycosyltransferase 61 catalytic domain-containing protein n=1 Tax=Panaeolus cyanescens TaxID=181874 RepID=A0A409YPZ4_9AGAR|nr:hypothetical protein CVT24_010257 [Panaeolus cyanescens]